MMTAPYATFALAPAMRAGGLLSDGHHRVHQAFMDFLVDGRPLLLGLFDLDAVSPLVSDVPPATLTTQVRRLLLEAEAPLAGGRHVIYGCPECESIDCGAVTAVIEREGTDVVWRDFAWQTYGSVDLERGGYRDMGPYRFDGEQYRREPERLLSPCGPAAPAPAAPREAGGDTVYVDVPVAAVPLLVARVEHALDRAAPARRLLVRLGPRRARPPWRSRRPAGSDWSRTAPTGSPGPAPRGVQRPPGTGRTPDPAGRTVGEGPCLPRGTYHGKRADRARTARLKGPPARPGGPGGPDRPAGSGGRLGSAP